VNRDLGKPTYVSEIMQYSAKTEGMHGSPTEKVGNE